MIKTINNIISKIDGESKSRIKGFDGVRAFAVLFVLAQHTIHIIDDLRFGAIGVLLFFVLSGYLIVPRLVSARVKMEAKSSNYWRELKSFYKARFLRIIPIYYVALIIILAMAIVKHGTKNSDDAFAAMPWLVSYLANIYVGQIHQAWIGSLGHFWSLAVEQQFYVFFGAFILLIPSRFCVATLIAMSLLSLSYLTYLNVADAPYIFIYTNSLVNFLPITVGGLCGLQQAKNLPKKLAPFYKNRYFSLLFFAFIVIAHIISQLSTVNTNHQHFMDMILITITGYILFQSIYENQKSAFITIVDSSFLRILGVVSYCFYIFHALAVGTSEAIVKYALKFAGYTNTPDLSVDILTSLVTLFLCFALSIVSFIYFEKPIMNKWKNR